MVSILPTPEMFGHWKDWASALISVFNEADTQQGREPLQLPQYTVAGVPRADQGYMIFVTDESGGPTPAYSDGTNWKRVADGNTVS